MRKSLLRQISGTLKENKAIVTKTDKGNTIVIVYQDEYDNNARIS